MGKRLTSSPPAKQLSRAKLVATSAAIAFVFLGLSVLVGYLLFERQYEGKVYPGVSVGNVPVSGKTPAEVRKYWESQNEPFAKATFEFRFNGTSATISGSLLDLGYDATLSATQAHLVGRSGHPLTDLYTKIFRRDINLTPYFRWQEAVLEETLDTFSSYVDIPVQDALFQFANGKVTAFRPSRNGRELNKEEAEKRFALAAAIVPEAPSSHIIIAAPVETIRPAITTEQVNSFGIKEKIGRGFSIFAGSIPGRIHNIVLAASRLNGVLIKPGEVFSFNETVGDISAATGYQSAYIIKDGRTVLGDGGGVCQVSSTLFRAALDAGLPIVERQAHAYRVHFYEDGGFKPGLDATVFAPTVDLKIKNDTPAYILIQAIPNTKNQTLTFELYGTRDGRNSQIINHKVWDVVAPPPPLYQDDPTLPPGAVRQVDWAAWGAKASFQYRVTRDNEVLQDSTFYSNFRPWQAVYLRGPNLTN